MTTSSISALTGFWQRTCGSTQSFLDTHYLLFHEDQLFSAELSVSQDLLPKPLDYLGRHPR
jgi:hypothetical protein